MNGQLNLQTPESDFATSHDVALDPKSLTPGVTYTYEVVAINQQGVTTTSAKQTFVTKGFNVSVGVFDKNHKPVGGKQVILHSDPMTGKTNDKGYVTFSNVTPGTHKVLYTTGGKTYSSEISVANNVQTAGSVQTAPAQNVSVVYSFEQHSNWFATHWVLSVLLLLVGAAGVFVYLRRDKFFHAAPAAVTTEPVVPVISESVSPSTPAATSSSTRPDGTQNSALLNNLPYPSGPQPGSTVAPRDDEPGGEV